MPYDVKMPQLGMTQDSGVIVAWLKTAGEKVRAGEPLFEVETDKATMEIEAAEDGYLTGIRAGKGDDVPVGDVIAVIVESETEVADHAGLAAPAELSAPPVPEPSPTARTEPSPEPERWSVTAPAAAQVRDGRVLASPKAKRLAAERGIDLAALRASGMPEPIHVSDLNATATGGGSALSARVDGAALDALLQRGGKDADRATLLAAFAAGGWRAQFNVTDVTIAVRDLDGTVHTLPNPDRGGTGPVAAAALALVDLCDTRLTGYAPAGGAATLSVARDGACYALMLAFSEPALPLPQAAALLDDIAARIEDPVRQLL